MLLSSLLRAAYEPSTNALQMGPVHRPEYPNPHKEECMKDQKTRLPLALELAEPKLLSGEVDIQLSSRTNTRGQSASFNGRTGIQVDVSADVAVDDVLA
jgi:hypothetical protein